MKQEQQQHEVALQQFELLKQEKDINKDIQVALIKASTMDTMGSGVDVPIDMQGIKDASVALIAENNKAAADQTKANLQKSKIESDERMNALNANVKKYDSDVKLKVAKSNKNKYDK